MLRMLQPSSVGIGIAVVGSDLVAVAVEVGSAGVRIRGHLEIPAFRELSPGEWADRYADFGRRTGTGHLGATLCLPREQVALRTLRLPPMRAREVAGAVSLQVDDLHPYGDRPVHFDWVPLDGDGDGRGARQVAVAVAEARRIDEYSRMFAEAGIALAGCTVSAVALRAVVRLHGGAPERPFVLAIRSGPRHEFYGESSERPLLSSVLDLGGMSLDSALRLTYDALGLRNAESVRLTYLGGELERPVAGFEVQSDDSIAGDEAGLAKGPGARRFALALGSAVESARRGRALGINLLPRGARRSRPTTAIAPRLALSAALVLLAGALLVRPVLQDRSYADRLREETVRLGGMAPEADREVLADLRGRRQWLLDRQGRARADLDLIRELARVLPPDTLLTALRFDEENSSLAGLAPDADVLLAILGGRSTQLDEPRFARAPVDGDHGEVFQIEARRLR